MFDAKGAKLKGCPTLLTFPLCVTTILASYISHKLRNSPDAPAYSERNSQRKSSNKTLNRSLMFLKKQQQAFREPNKHFKCTLARTVSTTIDVSYPGTGPEYNLPAISGKAVAPVGFFEVQKIVLVQ
jgi:hypothetical protein